MVETETWIGRIKEIKKTRGKVNEFLGMNLYFPKPGIVTADKKEYVEEIIEYFSLNLNK